MTITTKVDNPEEKKCVQINDQEHEEGSNTTRTGFFRLRFETCLAFFVSFASSLDFQRLELCLEQCGGMNAMLS